jgi:hypothetical protein
MMGTNPMGFNIYRPLPAAMARVTEMNESTVRKELSPAAARALAEAKARRERAQSDAESPKEIGGRNGPDPARFGDWEVKGIASDF